MVVVRSSGDVDPHLLISVVALLSSMAGFALLGVLHRGSAPRNPRRASERGMPGDETPAIVEVLTGGFDAGDAAIASTVLDLAARGHLRIDGPDGQTTIAVADHRPTEDLARYEERVVRHVAKVAGSAGPAPLEALTTGRERISKRWRNGFVRELHAEARGRGLCRRRWTAAYLAPAWGAVGLIAVLLWSARALGERSAEVAGRASTNDVVFGAALVSSLGLGALVRAVTKGNAQRDTDHGLAVAAGWLARRQRFRDAGRSATAAQVHDRGRELAYAAALGLAPRVLEQIHLGAEDDRRAWSTATGRHRIVRIRYLSLRPGWGQPPWGVALRGALQGAVVGVGVWIAWSIARGDLEILPATDPDAQRAASLGGLAATCALLPLLAHCGLRVVLGVADLVPRRTIEGVVVRARVFRTGHRLPRPVQWVLWSGRDESGISRQHRRRVRRHLAIDDGAGDSILALQVARDRMVAQGSRVRARVSPLLGYVAAIEVLEHPTGHERPVLHEMVEGVAVHGAGAMAGGLTAAGGAAGSAGPSGPATAGAEGLDQLGRVLDGLSGLTGGPRRSDGTPLIADVSRRLQRSFDAARQPDDVEDEAAVVHEEADGPGDG